LSCFYVNARSIVNKIDELELYLATEKPDIVGITETWAFEDFLDSEIQSEGYSIFRKDRSGGEKTRGGGVMLLISSELNITVREDLVDANFPESLWCSLESNREKTLIGICYRPPSSLKVNDDALFKQIQIASKERVLLMGDFNFPEIDWNVQESLSDSHPFIKCVNDGFLSQGVCDATRGKNILDLVLVSEENMIENLSVGEPFGSSDHQIIRWQVLICKQDDKVEKKTRDYFKADYVQMREVAETIWQTDTKHKIDIDVNGDWVSLKNELHLLEVKFVPYKKPRCGKCKWANNRVQKCRRAKTKAWKKYVESDRNQRMYQKYVNKLHEAQKVNIRAKRNFEQSLADSVKNNDKSFFAYVRSKQRTKDRVGPLMDKSGKTVTDQYEAANILNDYFSSVFTVEDVSVIPDPRQIFVGEISRDGLLDIDITEEIVLKKLEEINVNKCPGIDGIHPKLLHELRFLLAKPLTQLYRASLEQGIIPYDWREAGVTPLFKKGKKSDPQNYRPVSLTSILCKIFESIVKDKIIEHLDKFSLVNDSQHGFTVGRSCLSNLLEYMEEVTKILDSGDAVDVIYLDFAKAFDKVPHQRLFKKLASHGIGGKVNIWIKNWLTGRRQKVGLQGHYSECSDVISGVPQGSVLGPLLFLIYINDLDDNIISMLKKFADDTKICRNVGSDSNTNILQDDLQKIYQWSIDWQMPFNIDKCVVMHFGHNNKQAEYKMGNTKLRKSAQERDLGVIVDSSGKTTAQCVMAAKKANTVLGMIKRNIQFKSKKVIEKLYKALVRPKLEYCVQMWSPHLKKDIDILERVQKRATKMIEGFRSFNYQERLQKLGLMRLDKRRIRGDLIQVYKMLNGGDKSEHSKFFQLSKVSRTRGHSFKLLKKGARLDTRKYFFSQRVVNTWNRLPQAVVEATSVNLFKNRLDEFGRFGEA
jgi:ribonucleases P/MRP protein subunit RPP40